MRSLKAIWAFAISKDPPQAPYQPPVPSPYEVALALVPALVASGNYETPDAAVSAAWWMVPAYYQGAAEYNRIIAPALLFGVGPSEGEPMPQTEVQGL